MVVACVRVLVRKQGIIINDFINGIIRDYNQR